MWLFPLPQCTAAWSMASGSVDEGQLYDLQRGLANYGSRTKSGPATDFL